MFEERKADWRNTQIVYQIFVDRFERSDREVKYEHPRQLKDWSEDPKHGKFLKQHNYWSHELEFFGGDLQGVIRRLDYLKDLGINTIYFNPIFHAYTNHKYDTIDYFSIDPDFGTLEDLQTLCKIAHEKGIKIILDGVFNHVGINSTWFQKAIASDSNPYRQYFDFSSDYPTGYRCWDNVPNLPELNLEDQELQDKIFNKEDSIVQSHLDYIDGWRLDVASELGHDLLKKLTDKAHEKKEKSLIVGECWVYPDGWLDVMDSVMNYHQRQVIFDMLAHEISPVRAGRLIRQMIEDAGIEKIMKCWNMLSSHDTPRLKALLPDVKKRKIAQVLQFALPGAPMIYYGEELGMNGKHDPANRGPMQWEKLKKNPEEYKFYKQLIDLYEKLPALQYGDFRLLDTENLFAFCRRTDKVRELAIIAVNPHNKHISENVYIPEHRFVNRSKIKDVFDNTEFYAFCSKVKLELPPKSFRILTPMTRDKEAYSPFKRIR